MYQQVLTSPSQTVLWLNLLGFHIDLKNNGVFNENLGLAGFYNTTNPLTISGTKIPRFYNVEIAVDDNLYLDINTEITNNLSFISGHIATPRNTKNISIDFLDNATSNNVCPSVKSGCLMTSLKNWAYSLYSATHS